MPPEEWETMTMPLTLRPPRPEDENAVRELHTALQEDDFQFLHAEGSWEEILSAIERDSRGVDLPPGRVHADFLLAEVNGQIIGRTSIRYELNDFLRKYAGHVGYGVAPPIPTPRICHRNP